MIRRLQSTLDASRTLWPPMGNYIPLMSQVIQHVLGVFECTLRVTGSAMCWGAHACNHQLDENECTDIGKIE
jgi:hypothetical protein